MRVVDAHLTIEAIICLQMKEIALNPIYAISPRLLIQKKSLYYIFQLYNWETSFNLMDPLIG